MRTSILLVLFVCTICLSYIDDKALNSNYFTIPSGESIKVTVDQPKVEPYDRVTGHDTTTAKTSFPERSKLGMKKPLDVFIADLLGKSFMKTWKEDSRRFKDENKTVVGAYICSAK